jgi:hypothetical protein
MRTVRILLVFMLASAFAGVVVPNAGALGFEDNPCPLIDPANHQLKVCPDGEVGKAYTLQVLGKGGCTPNSVTYKVTSGTPPPGLNVSSSALISGIPNQPGRWKFYISVYDIPFWQGGLSWCSDAKVSSWEFAIDVAQGLQIVQRQSVLAPAQLTVPYSLQLTATGGTPTWAVSSGALPSGLTLNSSSGLLSGTPTTTGDYVFKITATAGSHSDSQTYTLSVVAALKITKPTSPGAEIGFPFSLELKATGGKAPYKWSATGLPSGLTLDPATGVVSGNPAVPSSAAVKVTVVDALGLTDTLDVSLPVAVKLALVRKALPAAKVGRAYKARFVATGGIAPRTWRILGGRPGLLPAGIKLNAATGALSGTPTKAGTYRIRVQATDQAGAHSSLGYVLKVLPSAGARH